MKHVIATTTELPPGTRKIVKIENREIGIFNVKGEYLAIRNICPHRHGPLCKGRTRPLVVSNGVLDIGFEREDEIIKCPWHQWEFDLRTGNSITDDNLRVRTYAVRVENENIVIDLHSRN
ncbi:MAG: Rieske (2Fe-2S) protein [Candidatus Latescibacterota bacterium]